VPVSARWRKFMRKNTVILVVIIAVFAIAHLILAVDISAAQTNAKNGSNTNKNRNVDEIDDVGAVIYAWANAWKNKDTKIYLSFYSPSFHSKDLNYSNWIKRKTKLLQRPGAISLEIFYLSVYIKNNRAYISFIQKYKDAYHSDVGEKKMVLVNAQGTWKITSEEWKPLAGESP
jgi:murein L,D-transpeptidase YafK